MPIEYSAADISRYYGVRMPSLKQHGKEWRGPCPIHRGTRDSFAVNPETGMACCHSACGRGWDIIALEEELGGKAFAGAKADVYAILGRSVEDRKASVKREEKWGPIDKIYDYVDETGVLRYQVVRHRDPKKFRQRRPSGIPGEFIWGVAEVERLPYNLPAVIAATKAVFVCYDEDTEILTDGGWLSFHELSTSDSVAYYDATTESVSFGHPSACQKFWYEGEMVNIRADWADLMVTPDHRMLSTQPKCAMRVSAASEIIAHREFPVAGVRRAGIHLDPWRVKLLVALLADGCWEKRGDMVSWNLKKDRKKQRLREILSENKIAWKETQPPSTPGWTGFRVDKALCPEKTLSVAESLRWDFETREVFIEELRYWDGDSVGRTGSRYFTAKKEWADAVSSIGAITGYGSVTRLDTRRNSRNYIVNLNRRAWRTITKTPKRVPYAGFVYCCTVPSGFIVVRRNGKTFIAGNCEGEKDCDTLTQLGITATTNSGGAEHFEPALAKWFIHKRIAIIPDNDEKGRKHAAQVAAILSPVAESIKIINLPGLPEKGDVTDFIEAGGTKAQLAELYKTAPPYDPITAPSDEDKYVRTFRQELELAGGIGGFWDMSLSQGIPTPWEKLTAALSGGLLNGEVYAIGASTGHGKTSLGLQFTITALRAGFGVLIYSMEMDWRSVLRRMVGIEARVDLNAFREAQLSGAGTDKAMRAALARYTSELVDMPLAVSRKGRVTPGYLVAESKRLKQKLPKLDLIIVDHLQLMSPDERKITEYDKFTSISRALKQSAVELNVPVLVMSQTTRGHAQDKREELELCDLRGSGAIEEDLAGCLLVYPDKKDEKLAKEETYPRFAKGPIKCWAKLAKNRYGESDVYFPLNHFKACTRFDPYTTDWRSDSIYAA